MNSISGKRFCQVLESRGWMLQRVNGSPPIFTKPGYLARISVPVHGHTDLKIGLLRHLMKVAGFDESDL